MYAKRLPTQIYLASNNGNKLAEIRRCLDVTFLRNIAIISSGEIAPNLAWNESGESFGENAAIKAKAVASVAPPGAWVVGEDSGLVVPALDGEPGVYSARYAGSEASDEQNNQKLLKVMESFSGQERKAHFQSTLVLIDNMGQQTEFSGQCQGLILREAKGSSGFGYDPLFFIESLGKTMAEMSMAEKNQHSHRGKSIAAMVDYIEQITDAGI